MNRMLAAKTLSQERLEQDFLSELDALERFRISYATQHPGVPLSHDDPDVVRLIEALAFFTVRTRRAALRSLDDGVQRIFRQHFPTLVAPIPAMAMIRATPNRNLVNATEVPTGTEVVMRKPADDDGAPERLYRFRTLAPLRLLPILISNVKVLPASTGGGARLLIRISAHTVRHDALRSLDIHINHLDDVRSSLAVAYELKSHLGSAHVLYGEHAREDEEGRPCQVSFGAVEDRSAAPNAFETPLQRALLRMRFPRQDLFMRIQGLDPGPSWQHLTVCLDLRYGWSKRLAPAADSLELHTVPAINVCRELANPIECDGTKDRYQVKHPDESGKFAPLWAVGAYRPTKDGFVPLPPSLLGVDGDSYEFMTEGQGEARRAWAMFRITGAYPKAQRLCVDAFWHQPGLRNLETRELRVGLYDRFVDGVSWSCSGAIVPYVDSQLDGSREAQLQVLSLKTLSFLGKHDLVSLLHACGARREVYWAPLVDALSEVRVTSKPHGKRTHGLKHVYDLTFDRLAVSDLARVGFFRAWLFDLLRIWSPDEVLEVVAHIPNLNAVLGPSGTG